MSDPSNQTESPTTQSPHLEEESMKDPGLYSLFVVSSAIDCNTAALESAANGEDGIYPVFLGESNNFSAPIDLFLADAECLEIGYHGVRPRLCGVKLAMSKTEAHFRMVTLTELFNFPYNEKRKVQGNTFKQCKSVEATKNAIQESSFFDTTSPIWVKNDKHTAYESYGFAAIQAPVSNDTAFSGPLARLVFNFNNN